MGVVLLSHAVMLLISLLALALTLHSAHNLPITVLQRLWDQAGVLKICHPMVLQIALHSAKMRTYWFDATAGQGRVALPTASQTILERPKATIAPHKVMQNAMVDAFRMVNGGNFLLDSRKRV